MREENQLFSRLPTQNSLPKWLRLHERNHKLFNAKLRAPKCLLSLFEERKVRWCFRPAHGVAEKLLYNAVLTLGRCREQSSQFLGRGKLGIRDPQYDSAGIQVQLHSLGLGVMVAVGRKKLNRLLLAPFADSIKFL